MNPVDAADVAFRDDIRTWLADHLSGEFADLRGMCEGGGQANVTIIERIGD